MNVEILFSPGAAAARLQLGAGEACTTEAGAMISLSSGLEIETTTHQRGSGGILKAAGRMLGGESFFLNHYSAGARGGEVLVAPDLPGDLICLDLKSETVIVQAGSYVASDHGIEVQVGWQGFKSLLSGESMFWLKVSGTGKLVLNSFGCVFPLDVNSAKGEDMIVDTGHIVAFQETLDFEITKAGGSWIHSFLGGEGLVCKFKGQGRLWAQSHNDRAFGQALGPLLPPR